MTVYKVNGRKVAKEIFMQNCKGLDFNKAFNCVRINDGDGNNPSIDQEIAKKGAIISPLNGKVYTKKIDYLNHLKSENCHIKDYQLSNLK